MSRTKMTGHYDSRERLQEEIYKRYRTDSSSDIAKMVGVSCATVEKIMIEINQSVKRRKELKELYGY